MELVDRCKATLCRSAIVRIDAGFPDNDTLSGLESRKVPYVARIRNNQVLGRLAEPYLKRPPGRPPQTPREWCYEESYQAGTWEKPRRVVLVVVERPGDLFLDHFWLITSLDEKRYPADKLLTLYRKRGKAEAHMGRTTSFKSPLLRPHLNQPDPRPWRSEVSRLEAGYSVDWAAKSRRMAVRHDHWPCRGLADHHRP